MGVRVPPFAPIPCLQASECRKRQTRLHRISHSRSQVFFACALPRRYTAGYEYAEPTECEVRADSRLPRDLLQQRADPRKCLGFLPGVRDHAAKLGDAGGTAKLSGDLSQPATGQGAHGASAAECVELRGRVWRD